jgi:hypothetical protein
MKTIVRLAWVGLMVAAACLPAADRGVDAAGPETAPAGTASIGTASTKTASTKTASSKTTPAEPRPTPAEAEARAELLHETFHAVLQVVHHQYYREDEGLAIPAATLKKVFDELAERKQVRLRWLAVDAEPMNSDHAARTELERKAVAALASGKDEYVAVEGGRLHRAGAIRLSSECLKCHAPRRTSTADQTAGLMISLPIGPSNKAD